MAANYVITISRQHGSCGNKIGKMTADRLGIPFYDYKLIRMASDRSGISEHLFGAADEDVHRMKLFNAANKVYTGKLLPPDSDEFTSDLNLFTFQAEIIKELAGNESCVIVGRCSDYILRDRTDVLNTFFHADNEFRADRIVKLYGETLDKPAKRLKEKDDKRRTYYRHYTGRVWGAASNYDVTLDSGRIGVEHCADIVVGIAAELNK